MCVYLDLTHIDRHELDRKLGGILEIYEKFQGVDPRDVPMKIFPAVHYSMGGLWADYASTAAGGLLPGSPRNHSTNIPGLYAIGECDYQYHGANRLGANSLLSCIFTGLFVAPGIDSYMKSVAGGAAADQPASLYEHATNAQRQRHHQLLSRSGGGENPYLLHQELGNLMTKAATVVRHNDQLEQAYASVCELSERAEKCSLSDTGAWTNQNVVFTKALIDMFPLAKTILLGAWKRDECRGAHYKPEFARQGIEAGDKDERRRQAEQWCDEFEANNKRWLKTTVAQWQDPEPVLSYEDVDTSLIPPRPRLYGLVGAEIIEEVWRQRMAQKTNQPDKGQQPAGAASTVAQGAPEPIQPGHPTDRLIRPDPEKRPKMTDASHNGSSKPHSFEVRILRQDGPGKPSYWERYRVTYEPEMNVISVLQQIAAQAKTIEDVTSTPVAWDCNCLEEVCGACTMVINGRVRQACSALVDQLLQDDPRQIELRPMTKFPVRARPMVDRSRLFRALETSQGMGRRRRLFRHGARPAAVAGRPGSELSAQPVHELRLLPGSLPAIYQDRTSAFGRRDQRSLRSTEAASLRHGLFRRPCHQPGCTLQCSSDRRDERLRATRCTGSPRRYPVCGNAQNCVAVCPKQIPLTTSIGKAGERPRSTPSKNGSKSNRSGKSPQSANKSPQSAKWSAAARMVGDRLGRFTFPAGKRRRVGHG